MKDLTFKKFVTSKTALAGLLVLTVVLISVQYRQMSQRHSIADEIKQLQDQQQSYEKKNQELSDSLQYLTSSSYKDKIARQQLGLKKNGEIVYGFSGDSTTDGATQTEQAKAVSSASHVEAWWLYLFHNQND